MILKIIGALMLAVFFIALFLVIAFCVGVRITLLIFGVTIIATAWIIIATYFLSQ